MTTYEGRLDNIYKNGPFKNLMILSLITKDLSNILVEFGILWDKIGIINDGNNLIIAIDYKNKPEVFCHYHDVIMMLF